MSLNVVEYNALRKELQNEVLDAAGRLLALTKLEIMALSGEVEVIISAKPDVYEKV